MGYQHYVKAVLADDPKFFYPLAAFDDLKDQSRYASPPVDQGSGFTLRRPKVMDGAPPLVYLGGGGTRYTATTSTNFYNASFMIECWAHMTVAAVGQLVLVAMATTGNPVTMIDSVPGSNILRFYISDSGGSSDFLNATYTTTAHLGSIFERPLHLVGGTDNTRADFWINGRLVASDTSTAGTRFTTTPKLFVGRYNDSFTSYFDGGIGLVAGYHTYDTSMAARHYEAAKRYSRAAR